MAPQVKVQLEERQRVRRRAMEKRHEVHHPVWFEAKQDPVLPGRTSHRYRVRVGWRTRAGQSRIHGQIRRMLLPKSLAKLTVI